MTKDQIDALPSRQLWAIVHSTSRLGAYWQQLVWAREELQRRRRKLPAARA